MPDALLYLRVRAFVAREARGVGLSEGNQADRTRVATLVSLRTIVQGVVARESIMLKRGVPLFEAAGSSESILIGLTDIVIPSKEMNHPALRRQLIEDDVGSSAAATFGPGSILVQNRRPFHFGFLFRDLRLRFVSPRPRGVGQVPSMEERSKVGTQRSAGFDVLRPSIGEFKDITGL